ARLRRGYPLAVAFAAAAAFLLLLFRPHAEETTHIKGETKVWLNRVGDQVNAEVTSDRSAVAFLAVYDNHGRMLSDPRMMLGNRLALAPGERAAFRQGFALTGPSEGEVLVVYVCELPKSGDCRQESFQLR